MSVTRFIPRKVMEGDKEIGEALEFSDGSIAIRFFVEKDKCHLLNLVPIQELGPQSKSSIEGVPDKMMKKHSEIIIDNVASRQVAERYHNCRIYEKVLNLIITELVESEKSARTREYVVKLIKSILFRERKAVSRFAGYLCYLTASNIIYLKKNKKGGKSMYFLNPFYEKTNEKMKGK